VSALGVLAEPAAQYARALARVAAQVVAEDLAGVYLYGSGATGPFAPGRSDLDLVVVVRDWLDDEQVGLLLERLRQVRRPRSVKGLDLWVVPAAAAAVQQPTPGFVAWILTAIDSELIGGPEHPGDARLVLILSECRGHGIAVIGPPAATVFGPPVIPWLLEAMRVDLSLVGAAGWYRVLNACRTMHYLETGVMCDRIRGADWARGRLPDGELIDLALQWRQTGSGRPMIPDRVAAFVHPVLARLEQASGVLSPPPVPAEETKPRVTVHDEYPLVSCVLLAPSDPELLALAARRFGEQDWWNRELLVLERDFGMAQRTLTADDRIRVVALPPDEVEEWAGFALQEAKGPIIATWDPFTWYAPGRLTQQVRELLSTSAPRLVAPSVLAYDPRSRSARRLHSSTRLEQVSLCAMRHAWDQLGTAARRGERSDLGVFIGVPDQGEGDPAVVADVQALIGEELDAYVVAVVTATSPGSWQPSVSCLMPTYNRRAFAARAIHYFCQQDYSNAELLILDDGENPVADLVPRDDRIRYLRMDGRGTIGHKRQLLCEAADGDVLVQWDDDDWYGASRLRRQIAPLAAGCADIAGILKSYLMDLTTFRFFHGGPPLHEGNLHASIIAGTLAFTRPAWRSTGGYPNVSIGEEVALLRTVLDRGGRVAPIVNDGMYICVRHHANSWRLKYDAERGPAGWAEVAPPEFLSSEDLAFYRSLHGVRMGERAPG